MGKNSNHDLISQLANDSTATYFVSRLNGWTPCKWPDNFWVLSLEKNRNDNTRSKTYLAQSEAALQMVRQFGIANDNTQWTNGTSSIFPYFSGPFPLIEKTQNKEWVFVNHGTTTQEKLKQLEKKMRPSQDGRSGIFTRWASEPSTRKTRKAILLRSIFLFEDEGFSSS